MAVDRLSAPSQVGNRQISAINSTLPQVNGALWMSRARKLSAQEASTVEGS